jgi:hypothetical protein
MSQIVCGLVVILLAHLPVFAQEFISEKEQVHVSG